MSRAFRSRLRPRLAIGRRVSARGRRFLRGRPLAREGGHETA